MSEKNFENVGHIEVRQTISLSDTSYFYDEPILVDTGPGKYAVSVEYAFPEGHRHVAALRALVAETDQFSRGAKLGNIQVDFAQIGICDRDVIEAAFDSLGDDGMSQYYDLLNTTTPVSWIYLPGSAAMCVVRPGYGDGSYPVYELRAVDGALVGVELEFIIVADS
ncbi:DUF4241 domain-containing protein [Rhizobacter sp. SG703]|uniref:DUF4241 domain-containing protein n=1 Tax=Rhizobacter sp. SG703 TaxID=2587140 RepID=UPI0014472E1A|nr:DUF4241 domain-containing protein [Rhizobacter sp. SG703]NKI96835.1 hypothetical protein [Rhizobacter sp. SG703]